MDIDNKINKINKLDINLNSKLEQVIVEYIFIDGFNNTRSKTRIITPKWISDEEGNKRGPLFNIDVWNVDGSSTGQSETAKSDIILIPRALFNDPFNKSTETRKYILCICDVFDTDGTPHSTNNRAKLYQTMMQIGEQVINDNIPLFGIEQEYVILEANGITPYNWCDKIKYSKQGPFYCGVGADRNFGRVIAQEHMNKCLDAGVKICGVNAEAAPSQWEFQVGICDPFGMGDHLWMARYILARVAESHGVCISYDPKPFGPAWNGSGAHTNFSTAEMRAEGGIDAIHRAIKKLEGKHTEHMSVYGVGNNHQMTRTHETSDINTFTNGECDLESSIRIPINVKVEGRGYLEDRRPASNADPYLVCSRILETILADA
jgi:glutamine synthetase